MVWVGGGGGLLENPLTKVELTPYLCFYKGQSYFAAAKIFKKISTNAHWGKSTKKGI